MDGEGYIALGDEAYRQEGFDIDIVNKRLKNVR